MEKTKLEFIVGVFVLVGIIVSGISRSNSESSS